MRVWRESDLNRVWWGRVLEKQSPLGPVGFFGVKNSMMCGRREERKVREPQRMSWKFCWFPPPPAASSHSSQMQQAFSSFREVLPSSRWPRLSGKDGVNEEPALQKNRHMWTQGAALGCAVLTRGSKKSECVLTRIRRDADALIYILFPQTTHPSLCAFFWTHLCIWLWRKRSVRNWTHL